jgi:glutamyl-tRNA reductase
MSHMMQVLCESDLVFTATSATEPLIDRAKLEMHLGQAQSLMLFDIAVPRNVAADANELASVNVFNVDDLKAVVAQNQESRRQMALEAESILDQEMDAFDRWTRSLDTVATISCLRNKIEAMTRGIVNKILHDPMVQLRAQQDIEARHQAMETLQTLFNLEISQQYS